MMKMLPGIGCWVPQADAGSAASGSSVQAIDLDTLLTGRAAAVPVVPLTDAAAAVVEGARQIEASL